MFAFPNKERRLAWIRNVVERRSFRVHSPELPVSAGYNTALYVRGVQGTTSRRQSSANSPISTFSLNVPAAHSKQVVGENQTNSNADCVTGLLSTELTDAGRPESQRDGDNVIISMGSVNVVGKIVNRKDIIKFNHHPSMKLWFYYDIMYGLGVTVYSPSFRVGSVQQDWMSAIKIATQKVLFSIVTTLSAFQSLCLSKRSFLEFMSGYGDNRYNAFVEMSFGMSALFAKSYATYLMVLKSKETDKMFQRMKEYEELCDTEMADGSSAKFSRKWNLVALLAFATVTAAGLRAFLAQSTDGIEDLMLQSSQELGVDLFVWKTVDFEKSLQQIQVNHGTNMTATAKVMGSVVIIRDACSYLQTGMIYDLLILVGLVLFHYVMEFMGEVEQVTVLAEKYIEGESRVLQQRRERLWRKYQTLKSVNDAVNDLFDPLLKMLHLNNLMMYAFFMILFIFHGMPLIGLFLYAVNMLKAEAIYFIAGKIAEKNDKMEEWISNWALRTGKILVDNDEMDAHIVLRQMEKQAIGLGKGEFLMHQTFHYKFLGLVLSVFFSMADEEKKN